MASYQSTHSGLEVENAVTQVQSVAKSANSGKYVRISSDGSFTAETVNSGVTGVKGNAESSYRTGNVNLTPANIGAATSAQGTKADSAVQTIQINGTAQTKTDGVVNLPAYPTSLPASNTTDSYSSTGTAPVSGKAVAAALGTLDVTAVGGDGKYIKSISETDGKISTTAAPLDKSAVGLGNVENKSSATIRGEITSSNVTTALGYTPLNSNLKGANSGLAELGSDGKVPSAQLPSYVDDVLEYDNQSSFPATGEAGKIYIAKDTNKTYRWSGTAYVEISASLALGETSSTAYRGDRGASAYAHAVTNKGAAFNSGMYKITTNAEGHVTAATAIAKSDITGLGIPAQETTYVFNTTYDATTNKAATIADINNAIGTAINASY